MVTSLDRQTVMDYLKQLPLGERLGLIADVLKESEQDAKESRPKKSLRGIVAHLGPAPSADDIDEARREAWANFPRDDI